MKRQERRSDCPISFALETFGDTWTLLIIRDLMFKNKRTFLEFVRSEERIATNILAKRLRDLENAGVIRKDGPERKATYRLTKKGTDLLPILVEMIAWSAKYDPDTAADRAFVARIRRNKQELIEDLHGTVIQEHRLRTSAAGRASG